jgi:Uma2 family endonuclease
MIAQIQKSSQMSPDEYLDWEAKQELRYEYIDGEIIVMTGGSIAHNDLALNLYRALYPHLRQRGCRVNVADVKVQAKENSRYFYPDLLVTCNSEDLKARDYIQHPIIIVEVLSPGTAGYDYGKKFKYYRSIDSLEEYILISPFAHF